MAVWQFKFSFVPTASIRGDDGTLMDRLEEYSVSDRENFDVDQEFEARWDLDYLKSLTTPIRELIGPVSKHWSGGLLFGDEEGDCIELFDDLFCVRISARSVNLPFIEKLIRFGKERELSVVIDGSGKVIECELYPLLEEFVASGANAFCANPAETLKKIGTPL